MPLFLILFSVLGLGVCSDDVNFDNWIIDDLALFPTIPIAAPWSEEQKCREDSRKLMVNLKNKTFWAMQMWDSSAKTEFGMLYGNVYQGGNFDECLSVREPIKSQYCGVSIRVEINEEFGYGDPFDLDPQPTDSVWKKLKDSQIDRSKYPRDNATWGICVPASCSYSEVEKSVLRHLDRVNAKFNGSIKYIPRVAPDHCQTQETIKFSAGEIAFWCTTLFIFFLVVSSSCYDFLQESCSKGKNVNETKPLKLFTSFSLKRNVPRMFSADQQGPKELNVLYPAKYLTIVFIIFAHRLGIFFSSPIINYQTYEENLRSVHSMFFPHGDLLVDTFFFISGLLGSFVLLSVYQKKFVNPALIIFGRFLRLAPLYYFLVWFHTDGIYRMGSGPVWLALKPEVEFCHKNWWTNILFVNNFVNIEESCMLHTWYIPCDFHLFILAVFLAILIKRFEKIGVGLIVVLTIVTGAVPALYTYYYRLFPMNMYYHYNLGTNIRLGSAWKYLYVPTQSRAAVYFMGFLGGYAMFKTQEIKKKMHLALIPLNLLLFLGFLFAPMVYGSFYYDPKKPYDVLESSLFASFRRISWGVGAVIFIFTYRFSIIPVVTRIVDSNFFVPLSKITYSIYLVHFYMITTNLANVRIPNYYRYYDLFLSGLGDVITASAYGAVLYLTVELPFKVFFHELLFAKVINKAVKKVEERENRTVIQDALSRQNEELPPVVSVKL